MIPVILLVNKDKKCSLTSYTVSVFRFISLLIRHDALYKYSFYTDGMKTEAKIIRESEKGI